MEPYATLRGCLEQITPDDNGENPQYYPEMMGQLYQMALRTEVFVHDKDRLRHQAIQPSQARAIAALGNLFEKATNLMGVFSLRLFQSLENEDENQLAVGCNLCQVRFLLNEINTIDDALLVSYDADLRNLIKRSVPVLLANLDNMIDTYYRDDRSSDSNKVNPLMSAVKDFSSDFLRVKNEIRQACSGVDVLESHLSTFNNFILHLVPMNPSVGDVIRAAATVAKISSTWGVVIGPGEGPATSLSEWIKSLTNGTTAVEPPVVRMDGTDVWGFDGIDKISPVSLSKSFPDVLFSILYYRLYHIYDAVSHVLHRDRCYARHDMKHIQKVWENARNLYTMEMSTLSDGATEKERQEIIDLMLATLFHDIANINRDQHPIHAREHMMHIIRHLFEDGDRLLSKEGMYYRLEGVADAIVIHETDRMMETIALLAEKEKVSIHDADDIIKGMERIDKELKIALMLYVSDKWEVGPHRLSSNNCTRNHDMINRWLKLKGFDLQSSDGLVRFVIDKKFDLTYGSNLDSTDEQQIIPEQSVHVEEMSLENEARLAGLFWSLYKERMVMSVYALFTLYPHLQSVTVEIDKDVAQSGTVKNHDERTEEENKHDSRFQMYTTRAEVIGDRIKKVTIRRESLVDDIKSLENLIHLVSTTLTDLC